MWDDIIETEKYIIRLKHKSKLMEYVIKEGVTYEPDDAIEAKREVVKRRPDDKFYVLAEGVEFFTFTKEAREHCSTAQHLDNTKAVAFYTTNISIQLLGEIYNKINKPAVPTKVFTNRKQALSWLYEQMKLNNEEEQEAAV